MAFLTCLSCLSFWLLGVSAHDLGVCEYEMATSENRVRFQNSPNTENKISAFSHICTSAGGDGGLKRGSEP